MKTIQFGRNGFDYIITNTRTGQTMEMPKHEAKALCRFLMIELNIISAKLNDGREVFEQDDLIKIMQRHNLSEIK